MAQQGGQPRATQCDIMQTSGVTLGAFDVSLTAQAAGPSSNAGLMGTVRFDPDPHGPYSSEIGLVQAVSVTDVAGTTNHGDRGGPMDWGNDVPGGANPEAGRGELMTTGADGAPRGTFIDSATANARGNATGPNYIEHFHSPPPVNQFGWLRSPTDFGPASLWDFPNSPHDVDFQFETVAKGTDNQQIYGALHWGFSIRSGAVVPGSDTAQAVDGASGTFEEALERFRGFFVHEPWCCTSTPAPRCPSAARKPSSPTCRTICGVTPRRARRRRRQCRRAWQRSRQLRPVGPACAERAEPAGTGRRRARPFRLRLRHGETDQFSQHGTAFGTAQPIDAGRLRANRRVVISFEHSVSATRS